MAHDMNPEAAKEHLAAIGLVAGAWALFETFLDSLALELAQIDSPAGFCFTAQISGWNRKLDAYIAVARLRGLKSTKELEKFAKDTAGLAEQRNRVVHDPWLLEGGKLPTRFEVTARRVLRTEHVEVPTEKVLALDKTITAHVQRFISLHETIVAELAASPTTSRG